MKQIKINQQGYVQSPYIRDAYQTIEISDELYAQMSSLPFNSAYKYENGTITLEELKTDNILRSRRQSECFNIINRGQVWYNNLTLEQKQELQTWYNEWLNVTDTKVIPTAPKWLK